jgi:hypothetical protein
LRDREGSSKFGDLIGEVGEKRGGKGGWIRMRWQMSRGNAGKKRVKRFP